MDVPARSFDAPLRIPVSNVFRGQTATAAGLAVSGRIESGIVQVGERLACLPGDESGVVRCKRTVSQYNECLLNLRSSSAIEVDGVGVPWAVAGANATIFLAGVDPQQLR